MSDKKREDSWNDVHDKELAKTVLTHIRNGSTQLAAFEEVASRINRTQSACGFRWNKELRKQYENEVLEAKQNRSKQKPVKKEREIFVTVSNVSADSPSVPVSYNEALKQIIILANEQIQKYNELLQENIELREEINNLKSQKQQEVPEGLAKEDLDAFLQIMKRAKSLTHA
ncbi:hypothetical protein [Paenibacillus sp. yr247]|uniref:hypothetical protein n=1 Tax=Paenibacillus sp. yr247 TaxID=1761880 RepID=UPI000B8A1A90|nr:hypothetical protein [Paenibacillus sp. yr247]